MTDCKHRPGVSRRAWRRRIAGRAALGLLAAGSAGGCSLAPAGGQAERVVTAAVDAGIDDRRAYNDRKAETLLTLPCDISLGAYYRLENAVQQEALTMLCSGKRPGEAAPALVAPSNASPSLAGTSGL